MQAIGITKVQPKCPFCNFQKHSGKPNGQLRLIEINNEYFIQSKTRIGTYVVSGAVNYCPMCGRNLNLPIRY